VEAAELLGLGGLEFFSEGEELAADDAFQVIVRIDPIGQCFVHLAFAEGNAFALNAAVDGGVRPACVNVDVHGLDPQAAHTKILGGVLRWVRFMAALGAGTV